jgi:hypothetical protein
MPSYQSFTSPRATEPDPAALLAQLRALDPTAGVQHAAGSPDYIVKKATAWTAPQIAAAQNAIDTAPAVTPQRQAQNEIDQWPISVRALVLALIDQLNTIRAALPTPLPAITPAQALAAIRTKAGTL